MLDFDLAELYGTETKYLKRSVKNNIRRFPVDFMFELNKEEWDCLRCKNFTLKAGRGQHPKYLPYAFTELGVAMLSSVLNSEIAVEVNISIMRAFVAIRQIVLVSPYDKVAELEKRMETIENYIEEAFTDYNDINEDTRMQIELINQALAELQIKHKQQEKIKRPRIGFIKSEGEV